MTNKKILHITRSQPEGPGIISYTLHNEMIRNGYQSKILTIYKTKENVPGLLTIYNHKYSILDRIRKRIAKSFEKKTPCNWDFHPYGLTEQKNYFKTKRILKKIDFVPDIIILYFINQFLNALNIKELQQQTGARILWVLPDMAAMTGGCHYAWQCRGYERKCGACPAIYSKNQSDITKANIEYKIRNLSGLPLEIICPSSHLLSQVKNSSVFKKNKTHKILLSVDPRFQASNKKSEARKYFNIQANKRVVFIGAQTIKQKRKGTSYIIEALNLLYDDPLINNDDIYLLIAGESGENFINSVPFPKFYAGYLDLQNQLPLAFQASDLFVNSSIEDSGPLMVNYSIMSGTPVVAFKMGVVSDLIINGKTGFVANLRDSRSLAEGIKRLLLLNQNEYKNMCTNCSKIGKEQLHPKAQFKHFEAIIK